MDDKTFTMEDRLEMNAELFDVLALLSAARRVVESLPAEEGGDQPDQVTGLTDDRTTAMSLIAMGERTVGRVIKALDV